ncbi:immunoglobulin domain-containing protein [Pedobacter sp. SL55]|uniref:immunoglobulin domain-containing protein n=1 Tax=Pedobacter sp. SL55 TaxID=2995161 RepID=UPI00226FF131|nr:hypothetical protein [Pedobacter sp. SL55]WAC42517.1 hypothetical protein OVA16_09245 [Pedobacter sp. SL55]
MKKILLVIFCLLVSKIAFSQQTMYWFGGAGNWNDLSHWSFQSGGGVHPTLGLPSSVPTADTHVIFDGNSGLNATGTTTAQLAARTVTLGSEVVIRSLTFDASIATANPRISNGFNIRVTEDVTLQAGVSILNASFAIAMEPVVATTTTLTLNGAVVPLFSKGGAGTLNINGVITSGRYNFAQGIANYLAPTATFNVGLASFSLTVVNSAILNAPNLTNLDTRGNVQISGTAQFNAPLLEHWIRTGANNNTISILDNVHLNLPALKTWEFANMAPGTATATITIPDATVVTARGNWSFVGNLNAGTSEFHVEGTEFRTKAATAVNKVFMENPVATTAANIYGTGSTINELHFVSSNGYFQNGMTIGKLYLAPSRAYTIYRNSMLTITENIIDSTPDCQPFWQIYSSETAFIARINNASGNPINLENAILTRINVTNGVINVVGVDNGNNSTIGTTLNFVEPPAKTIYWVGAAGDDEWNNQANWSATSGGAGGFCLPTQYDDVIFDNNSVVASGSVKITANNAFFHDITVQNNAPVFNFVRGGTGATNMTCYGSWYMRSGMVVAVDNVQFRSADMGETITSNGSFFRITYFQGLGGWTFQDSFQTQANNNYHLYFRGASLNTNNQTVFIGGNFIGNETITPAVTRNLILGSSQISLVTQWLYNATVNTLNAGTSHITLRNGDQFYALANHVYYDVTSNIPTPTTTTSLTILGANVTYHNFHVFNQLADFQNTITANEIRIMPVQLRASLLFRGSVTTNILEIQKNGLFRAFNNVLVTVNQNFITHTLDCQGLMEMYVNGKTPGQFFRFRSANNVFVPNVWMTGVSADLTSGATYTATGLEDTDVTNWTFTVPPAKELYWIGVADNNWNNGLNWTTNSNGVPSPGGCVPTKYDNVHFNSFSTGNLPINILDQPAYFNNLIGHSDAPSGITITSVLGIEGYAYGNLIQMAPNMTFVRLNLMGDANNGQLINNGTSAFGHLTVNNANANWVFTGNTRVTSTYSQIGATVTVNGTSWTGGNIQINGIALNLNVQTVTANQIILTKGALKASDLTMTLTDIFSGAGNNATANARSLDIRNSNITVAVDWLYYNLASATLQATGSTIKFGRNFWGQSGHEYGTIETGETTYGAGSAWYLRGGIKANRVVVNHSKSILDNNTFGTLFLKPRGYTLWLGNNSTQTVTEHLYLSGTPCLTNVLRAGTETGATQASAIATINYTNATPTVANVGNTFDYVRVGGINASNSKLFLQVNATQLGLNTNVENLAGMPGLVGLGPDVNCQVIDPANASTYTITADQFSAGPEATFVWYKRMGGVFQNLNLPSTTRAIDVRNFGYDGVYRVELLYDPLNPVVAERCPQADEITVSYTPNIVGISAGADNLAFCDDATPTIGNLQIDPATTSFMTSTSAILEWYAASTGGSPLASNTPLTNGMYYASLKSVNNCYSAIRTPVTVTFYAKPTANAGPDQRRFNTVFTMVANQPAVGTGTWSVVTGSATIANPSAYNTSVTITSGDKVELRWSVNNNGCMVADEVKLFIVKGVATNPAIRSRAMQ